MEKEKKVKEKMEMFDNIIGYDDKKKVLRTVVDMLNNNEKYEKLGCSLAHGLLLYGPPGTGKTSMAKEILNNVKNRKSYTIRKTKSDGSFINHINKIFKEAVKNQPSIILLDDLDKFSEIENEKRNSEEYVAIQSMIDDINDENVFVIATVNEKYFLPESLTRSGRFDIQVFIDNPKEGDAYKIFEHYLSDKQISEDVDAKKISNILGVASCAELEKICNQAGIYAGFKNKKKIGMNDFIKAALEMKFDTNIEDISKNDKYIINTAYHEAGHTLIAELLEPGSISFVTVTKNDSNTNGITIFHDNDYYSSDIKFMKNRVKSLLAGKAATEIVFNTCDVGTCSDLSKAYRIVNGFVDDYCMSDFNSHTRYDSCDKQLQSKDDNVNKIIRDYYEEVKDMLIKNRKALDALAKELSKKKILFQEEIESIIENNCKLIKFKKAKNNA